jgi:hypothetical protein
MLTEPKPAPLVEFEVCGLCGTYEIRALPYNWTQAVLTGHAISIVGCGNPWHYRFPDEGDPGPIRHE